MSSRLHQGIKTWNRALLPSSSSSTPDKRRSRYKRAQLCLFCLFGTVCPALGNSGAVIGGPYCWVETTRSGAMFQQRRGDGCSRWQQDGVAAWRTKDYRSMSTPHKYSLFYSHSSHVCASVPFPVSMASLAFRLGIREEQLNVEKRTHSCEKNTGGTRL